MNAQSVQNDLPYYQIPDYPKKYNACTVAARLIDGLGFRYYWATEGLRNEDLKYKPSEDGRMTEETLSHIYGLVLLVLNAVKEQPNVRPAPKQPESFGEKRAKTLSMIKEASDILKASKPKKMKDFNMIFKRGENETVYPFWNEINGPISDALWHCGQVVLLRRASGNPFNSKVSVLQGKVRE